MNKDKAMKLALELLDKQWQCEQVWSLEESQDVADIIREALAEQPTQQGHSCYCPNCEALSKELAELQAQKPIAWRVKWPAIGGGYKWMMVDSPLMEKEGFVNEALYTSPQPAQQEPCKACNGTGETETGIGMMVCDECHGTAYTSPPAQRKPLTDEQIDKATRKQADDLLDHIYEYGTAAEGVGYRIRAISRAIEAAHNITGETK